MSEHLSCNQVVVEESPGVVRWALPARPPQPGRWVLGFGILASGVAGLLLVMTAPASGEAVWIPLFVLTPLFLFGLVPVAVGLWLSAGRVEIELRDTSVRSLARLGPLRWTRSVLLDRVRRFQVSPLSDEVPGLAVLQAELIEGRPALLAVLYPHDVLQGLAEELSGRCEGRMAVLPSGNGELTSEKEAASGAELPTGTVGSASSAAGDVLRWRLECRDDIPGCTLAVQAVGLLLFGGFLAAWGRGLLEAHQQPWQAWRNEPALARGWLCVQTMFFVPFAGAGLWGVGLVLRQAYQTFLGGRWARVEISSQPLHPGEEFELFLSQPGPLRLKRYHVSLVCEEEETTGVGDEACSKTHRADEVLILCEEGLSVPRSDPYQVRRSSRLPDRALPSFDSPHNKVRWEVVVAADVAAGPSFEHHFPIVVHPPVALLGASAAQPPGL